MHREKNEERDVEETAAQRQLMRSQDLKYLRMKQTMEMHKIDKMQSSLHMLGGKPLNTHTFFVDKKRDGK